MQIGVQSQPQDNESGLAVLLTLPLSFLGLGAFRAWMWLLPVLSPQAPALEQFHDLLLCAALLLLAALARKVVPIGLNRWAQIVCGITAFAGSSIIALNVAMPFAPAASYVGIAFVALAAAILVRTICLPRHRPHSPLFGSGILNGASFDFPFRGTPPPLPFGSAVSSSCNRPSFPSTRLYLSS